MDNLPIKTSKGWEERDEQVPDNVRIPEKAPEKGRGKKPTIMESVKKDIDLYKDKIGYIGYLSSKATEEELGQEQPIKKLLYILDTAKEGVGRSKDDEKIDITHQEVNLTLSCLLAIFLEILPEYPIRELTEKERNTKVSITLKTRRDKEMALVSMYHKYVQKAIGITKLGHTEELGRLQYLSYKCLLELVKAKPFFNFNNDVIKYTVKTLAHSSSLRLQSLAASTWKEIFGNDNKGKLTWMHLTLISNEIFRHGYKAKKEILESLLSVRQENLRMMEEDASYLAEKEVLGGMRKKSGMKMTRMQKKRYKKSCELNKELERQEASDKIGELNKCHVESSHALFRIYVGIIRKNPDPLLLDAVFTGLLTFSNLIDDRYFSELIVSFKELILADKMTTLSTILSIHAIMMIFDKSTASCGGKDQLSLDLYKYYYVLYEKLLKVPFICESLDRHPASISKKNKPGNIIDTWKYRWESDQTEKKKQNIEKNMNDEAKRVDALVKCIELGFLRQDRYHPLERIVSFVHRLLWIGLQAFEPQCIKILILVRKLMQRYPDACSTYLKKEGFEEEDLFGSGIYMPMNADPDSSCSTTFAINSILDLFRYLHPSERVREVATQISQVCSKNT